MTQVANWTAPDVSRWNEDWTQHMLMEVVKGMVQYDITCKLSGEVLDMRTCMVIVDDEADPMYVFGESVLEDLKNRVDDKQLIELASKGKWILYRNDDDVWEVLS